MCLVQMPEGPRARSGSGPSPLVTDLLEDTIGASTTTSSISPRETSRSFNDGGEKRPSSRALRAGSAGARAIVASVLAGTSSSSSPLEQTVSFSTSDPDGQRRDDYQLIEPVTVRTAAFFDSSTSNGKAQRSSEEEEEEGSPFSSDDEAPRAWSDLKAAAAGEGQRQAKRKKKNRKPEDRPLTPHTDAWQRSGGGKLADDRVRSILKECKNGPPNVFLQVRWGWGAYGAACVCSSRSGESRGHICGGPVVTASVSSVCVWPMARTSTPQLRATKSSRVVGLAC